MINKIQRSHQPAKLHMEAQIQKMKLNIKWEISKRSSNHIDADLSALCVLYFELPMYKMHQPGTQISSIYGMCKNEY